MRLKHIYVPLAAALFHVAQPPSAVADERPSTGFSSALTVDQSEGAKKLWFDHPAAQWNDAQPVGNGRVGAMIFGGITDERIQFNESTLWNGQPHDYARPTAPQHLAELRQLIFDGKDDAAKALATKEFLCVPQLPGGLPRQKAYQPFGDLMFHFDGTRNATDYHRELNLETAIDTVSYKATGTTFTREVFSSYPDQVLIIHLTASEPHKLAFDLRETSPHKNYQTKAIAPDTLSMTGHVEDGGTKFESRLHIAAQGGATTVTDSGITVANADEVTLVLSAATSFKNFQDITANPAERCEALLSKAKDKPYATLLAGHEADYTQLFNRVELDLGPSQAAAQPTDVRLKQIKNGALATDPALAALYFNFGRYLLIACSREGENNQPANLQGMWNDQMDPPWESKFTTNINLEMNYWPAEVGNLSDCTPPLFALIDDLVKSGERTAKEHYNCRGWVLNHNTDIWCGTAPINGIDGIWPTGGAWLCQHLWEHYQYSLDKNFLAKAYPVMKDASLFFMDFLVKDPKTGWLVSCPSYSPEQGNLCAGPTMDQQLIRALMDHTLQAASILNIDKDFSADLAKIRAQVSPDQVGKEGQLQEWLTDIDKPNNNHRHMSPLWGLFPGDEITPADPKIFDAAKVLLKWRGDGSTGWSYAWRIPIMARTGDGEGAYKQFATMLDRKTLPNMLDLCGPFQIDGNFGAPAGIAEMLLQSHQHPAGKPDTFILDLLPALPKEWPKGSITGLRARGNFEVDLAWDNGKLTTATIHSNSGAPCIIRYGTKSIDLATQPGAQYKFNTDLASMLQTK